MFEVDAAAWTVAVVGGGVSGALTAYQLRQQQPHAQIVVIDPRAELGLGLAYSTPSLRHLLNVPAGKISALPNAPDHFLVWLRGHYAPAATRETFAPRAVFGRYMRALLAEAERIAHVRASVVDIVEAEGRAVLTLDNGQSLGADRVVLAMGNFDPAALPDVDAGAMENGAYCHSAWQPETYGQLAPDAEVLLVGTGLTAVDVVQRLREQGHRGVITAISRRGMFPQSHAEYTPLAASAIPAGTRASCLEYLRMLRATIARGVEWRAAVDSLRATANDLWLALSAAEQKRFRRHLQRRWDVVRHRMAPPAAALIQAELAAGTLVVSRGRVAGVKMRADEAVVTVIVTGGSRAFRTQRVINCTGPCMQYRRLQSPLLQSLFARGYVSAGGFGEGFRTTRTGAIIDAKGEVSPMFYSVGPARQGTLLEAIAVPELRQQALEIARALAVKGGRRKAAKGRRARTRAHGLAVA